MSELFSNISWTEIGAVVFAIAYLVLAIRQNVLCWPAALISVTLSLVLFYEAKLYMEAALQVFYIAMAIYGWYQWRRGGAGHSGVKITLWSKRTHALVIAAVIVLSVGFGAILAARTDAALPYADSFTTIGALVATYMVTKKVLENWAYWFVLDSVAVFVYVARDLYLYALLFVLYLVLIVIGYRRWRRDFRAEQSLLSGPEPRHA
ncbi:MAG TPA: nicotinamide riboside transporter PnuC [Gammaproteobacteria bacterium]